MKWFNFIKIDFLIILLKKYHFDLKIYLLLYFLMDIDYESVESYPNNCMNFKFKQLINVVIIRIHHFFHFYFHLFHNYVFLLLFCKIYLNLSLCFYFRFLPHFHVQLWINLDFYHFYFFIHHLSFANYFFIIILLFHNSS